MTDTQLTYLDGYCERAGDAGFWAEPLNAITNLAFIIAAFLAFTAYRKQQIPLRQSIDILILTVLLVAIGIGSTAWHTIATQKAMLGDVIPIALFIHFYLVIFLVRIIRFGIWPSIGCWIAFVGISYLFEIALPNDLLHGTIMYIPAYAVLILLLGALRTLSHPAFNALRNVVFIWTASLVFRTIDLEVCPMLHIGTHFLWHLINAVVLYKLVILLLKYGFVTPSVTTR
ncbi:MAG: hypothetical protein U1E36_03420 [Rickettsiales bacterium]